MKSAESRNLLLGRVQRWFNRVGRRSGLTRSNPMPTFIHIPKTGGTYIGQLETDYEPVLSPLRYMGHACVVTDRATSIRDFPPEGIAEPLLPTEAELASCPVIMVVRNPFTWLVSYAAHAGGWNPKYRDPAHHDYDNANRGLDYLLRSMADRESPWPSRKLIHFQLFSSGGNLIADHIARNETLDDDLARFAIQLGLRYRRKERQRVGGTGDHRKMYDDKLVQLVYDTWGRDLRLLGYSFDDRDPEEAALPRFVDASTKRRIRYSWEPDELVIDGRLVPRLESARDESTLPVRDLDS